MPTDIIQKLRNKNARAISKLISHVENEENNFHNVISDLYPHLGNAYKIGITGPPGAGKSTITDKLIEVFRQKKMSVAIIAIDPSSPFTGGSILGDRIRFINDLRDPNLFFRSMSTRGAQGGLSKSAMYVADIFDASGYDVIIFETVGVGQIEIDVIEAVDTVIVTLVPESGDDIQMMKSGLIEIADLYVINKSDRDGADNLYASLNKFLQFNKDSEWTPKILKTIALNGLGIEELYNNILIHKDFLNRENIRTKKINDRYLKSVKSFIVDKLNKDFWSTNSDMKDSLELEMKLDYRKRMPPFKMAEKFLKL